MMRFEHQFVEEPRYGEISDELFETPSEARIEFSINDEGVWLSANSEGFLHLARIFAELGTRHFEEGYHFHRPEWFKTPSGSEQEVSVEVFNGDWKHNA
jgi:hypothetical protein